HIVTDTRQLLRRRQAGRTGTDDGHALAGLELGRLRHDPAHLPGLVDDGVLDRLDAYRIIVDVQCTGRLAGRRADAAGEFREVVGRMQILDRLEPLAVVNEIVPVRNDVVDRAAAGAEGNAAVHAARA